MKKFGELGCRSKEAQAWRNMVERCTNPARHDYERYGGNGVSVCERWRDGDGVKSGFLCFLEDIGAAPSADHSIDRWPDNQGSYEPGNVRWATLNQQANNKKSSRHVSYRGEMLTIADAARRGGAGVPRETARCRMLHGWSVENAVETPLKYRRDKNGYAIKQRAE